MSDELITLDELAALFDEGETAAPPPPGPAPTKSPLRLDHYRHQRFLVIEDQDASRNTLKMCIQSMGGVTIDMAQGYGDAIYRIRRTLPDIIICDYLLGADRTGQQLLEELRQAHTLPDRVVFIMVTAERSYEQVISAVELVPDDYVIKPFSPEVLKLRIDKAMRKKVVFATFYEHRAAGRFDAAIEELAQMQSREVAKPYHFDILRCRAETMVAGQHYEQARAAYEAIITTYPFPWAKAGLARVQKLKGQLDEARGTIEDVIAMAPNYFESYDLKAAICIEQGDHDEAQKILTQAAARTPRNWTRKRTLSRLALGNGDHVTASQLMKEVIERDVLHQGGLADRMALARCAIASGDLDEARRLMKAIAPADIEATGRNERIEFECLLATAEGQGDGERRFARIRATIVQYLDRLDPQATADVIKTALHFGDRQVADDATVKTLAGNASREIFKPIHEAYLAKDLEADFRALQLQAAELRLRRQ